MSQESEATMRVGTALYEFCKAGKNMDAIDALYANDVVSVEASGPPDQPRTMTGIDAIRGKNTWWTDNHEVHSGEVAGPFPHGDRFILNFKYDVTAKMGPMKGKRFEMNEMALYTVADGKIVKEEFFYAGM